MPISRTGSRAALILGLAVVSIVLTAASTWAVVAQIVVLGVAIFELVQRPSKKDRLLLVVASGAIVACLGFLVAANMMVYDFTGDVEVTAVPVP